MSKMFWLITRTSKKDASLILNYVEETKKNRTQEERIAKTYSRSSVQVATPSYYMQLCLIRTDVDPKFLSGLGKIRIKRIEIICIGRDWDLPICPV